MARQDIEAGRAFVRVSMNDSALVKGIRNAQQRLGQFGKAATAVGAAFTGAGAAITGPLLAFANQFAAAGDAAGKMAARVGISAEAVQELKFAAEQSGAGMETVEKGLARMSTTLFDAARGSALATDALKELGLTTADLEGLQPDEQMAKIADGLKGIADESKRGAVAQQIFGRAGRQLLPMLSQGAAGIEALRKEARDLNIPLSNLEVKQAEDLTDAINRMKQSATTAKNIMGAAIAVPLTNLFNIMAKVTARVGGWIRENKTLFATVAAVGVAITGAGVAIGGLGIAATVASAAIGGILTVLGAIGAAAAAVASPLGIAAAVLVAGTVAWAKWTASGKAFVEFARSGLAEALKIAQDTFGGIQDALTSGDLALAAKIGFAGLKLAVAEGFNAIADLIGGTAGDTIAATFKDLVDGDFTGAMKTALQGLQALFLNWGQNIVNIMVDVAKKLVGIWRGASETIATSIDKQAAKGGMFGKVFGAVTGTDYTATAKRGSELDRQLAESRRKLGITDVGADSTNADFIGSVYDDWQKGIETTLDKANLAAIEAADEAADKVKQRVREIGRADTTDLAAQLDDLRRQAAEQAEAARANRISQVTGGEAGPGGSLPVGQTSFGTFSAAAAGAFAASIAGPQQRILRANEQVARWVEKLVDIERDALDAIRDSGVFFK